MSEEVICHEPIVFVSCPACGGSGRIQSDAKEFVLKKDGQKEICFICSGVKRISQKRADYIKKIPVLNRF